eukprot:3815272-Amphidinium_carterae.1
MAQMGSRRCSKINVVKPHFKIRFLSQCSIACSMSCAAACQENLAYEQQRVRHFEVVEQASEWLEKEDAVNDELFHCLRAWGSRKTQHHRGIR